VTPVHHVCEPSVTSSIPLKPQPCGPDLTGDLRAEPGVPSCEPLSVLCGG
jgi:hypothetical protein